MKEKFNWDKYFASAKWADIYENSPFFTGQRLPSLIHHEAGLVYLSSLDLDFSLSDADSLKRVVPEIQSILQTSLEYNNYYKAAIADADLVIIQNLLSELGSLSF